MTSVLRPALCSLVAVLLAHSMAARADDPDADADALSLTSAPVEAPKGTDSTSLFVEAAAGRADQRYGPGWQNLGRFTVDLSHSMRLSSDWHAVISDRVDAVHPADPGADPTTNSLREAYLSWQGDSGANIVDIGRVNLRYGPAYGYNPTDFFRDNTLRVITTPDPLALRQDRLGTFVLRGQHVWGDSAVSIALAPKLDSRPTTNGLSIDAGATNDRGRALLTFSTRVNDRLSGQVLMYKEANQQAQFGASVTALLSDSLVAYVEASRGNQPDLLSRAEGLDEPRETRNRISTGMTFTPMPKLSFTVEYEYNGFALDRNAWANLGSLGPMASTSYLLEAVNLQEISSRQAYLGYATLKDAGAKNLDVTALLRINGNDHSRLAWAELRYHWPKADLALQVQQQGGGQSTEFGILPYYRSVQLVATWRPM